MSCVIIVVVVVEIVVVGSPHTAPAWLKLWSQQSAAFFSRSCKHLGPTNNWNYRAELITKNSWNWEDYGVSAASQQKRHGVRCTWHLYSKRLLKTQDQSYIHISICTVNLHILKQIEQLLHHRQSQICRPYVKPSDMRPPNLKMNYGELLITGNIWYERTCIQTEKWMTNYCESAVSQRQRLGVRKTWP